MVVWLMMPCQLLCSWTCRYDCNRSLACVRANQFFFAADQSDQLRLSVEKWRSCSRKDRIFKGSSGINAIVWVGWTCSFCYQRWMRSNCFCALVCAYFHHIESRKRLILFQTQETQEELGDHAEFNSKPSKPIYSSQDASAYKY